MWNSETNQEILAKWRQLRMQLADKNTDQQVAAVAEFISKIPYGARCVDYYSPENWPTPWEILAHRQFCSSSISILAYHTLSMVSDQELTLELVDDGNDTYLVTVVNEQVINYYPNEVITKEELANTATVLKVFGTSEIKPVR